MIRQVQGEHDRLQALYGLRVCQHSVRCRHYVAVLPLFVGIEVRLAVAGHIISHAGNSFLQAQHRLASLIS